jgi:tRNA(Ile)-lysidine synthase
MENTVWEYIKENGLVEKGQNIGVAVSGGADSMALLVCLTALAGRHGFQVLCIHFEHGIRGEESLWNAEFVTEYCERAGIPLFMGAADVPALAAEWKLSSETAAKKARESYFDSLLESGDVDVVATAHHQDDNAESVLMHIFRGSGLEGLKGIHNKKGGYIRPLLCVDSGAVMRYVEEREILYVVDSTNGENLYRRNYIRNVLLKEIESNINPSAVRAVNRLSALVEEDIDFLEQASRSAFAACAVHQGDSVRIDAARLAGLHTAVAGRVIRMACARLNILQDIEKAHVDAVMKLAAGGRTGAKANLSRGLCAEMEYGALVICFAGREVDYSFQLRLDVDDKNVLPDGSYIECRTVDRRGAGQDNFCECFDRDKLPAVITLRTRHDGDVIHPLGAPGKKKLKDYFIDKKLTREQRAKTPLLADGGEVIWVVGHVMSDKYRVDGDTKNILQMRYTGRDA